MKPEVKVIEVTEENISRVLDFLESNSGTSLFLLSNLSLYGPKPGDSINSGNYKFLESDNVVCGVFCLTRRGNLLAETGGRTDFARNILSACANESFPIQGIVGEWDISDAIWRLLLQSGNFVELSASKEVLYRLNLSQEKIFATCCSNIRRLMPNDFEQWSLLNSAFIQEQGMPIQGTPEQQRAGFEESAAAGYWWGYMENGRLLATVALNALYKETGQVGGVYTTPPVRRRGFARTAMQAMIEDCVQMHGLRKLILFTGENNKAARGLYESLGFEQIGHYALLFGSLSEDKS